MSAVRNNPSKSAVRKGSDNAANTSESVAFQEPTGILLVSAAELEQQLGLALNGDLNQKHLQEVSCMLPLPTCLSESSESTY